MANMVVRRKKGAESVRIIEHKIADVRGGVSVKTSNLPSGILKEGAVLSTPTDGICSVIKVAKVVTQVAESAKTIEIAKGSNIAVGDYIKVAGGKTSVRVSAINSADVTKDVLTTSSAIGAVAVGGVIIEADNNGNVAKPLGICGTSIAFTQGDNVQVDCWLIATTKGLELPEEIAKELKGIVNY